MVFAFNFTFSVPGISNPFSAAIHTNQDVSTSPAASNTNSSIPAPTLTVVGDTSIRSAHRLLHSRLPSRSYRRPPSPLPPGPASRKRGWVPSSSEPSYASTVQTLSKGYLDTPAKYRDMDNELSEQEPRNEDQMEGELPPAKRRKGLAGSILSTALSAALIGTAVGVTVYRLWRDRGRQPEALPPPPPYQESTSTQPQTQHDSPSISVAASSPRARRQRTTTGRRSTPLRHRKARVAYSPPVGTAFSTTITPSESFDFKCGRQLENDNEDDPADQMDWIGDRISKLIQEGKKALGTEVVVMSDVKEDEVDDGSGAWEEDEPDSHEHTGRFSRHKRAKTPRHLGLPPSYSSQRGLSSLSSPVSLSRPSILPGSNSIFTPPAPPIDSESPTLGPSSWKESEEDWQSLEIRASMQKARALYQSQHQSPVTTTSHYYDP